MIQTGYLVMPEEARILIRRVGRRFINSSRCDPENTRTSLPVKRSGASGYLPYDSFKTVYRTMSLRWNIKRQCTTGRVPLDRPSSDAQLFERILIECN